MAEVERAIGGGDGDRASVVVHDRPITRRRHVVVVVVFSSVRRSHHDGGGRGGGGRDHRHVLLHDRVETVHVVRVVVDGPAAAVRLDQAVPALDHVAVAHLLLVLGVAGQRVAHSVRELVLRVRVGVVQLGRGKDGRGGGHWGDGGQRGCGGQRRCGGHGGGGADQRRGRRRERERARRVSGQRGGHGPGGGRQQRRPVRISGVRVGGGRGRVRQQAGVSGVRGRGGEDAGFGAPEGGHEHQHHCRLCGRERKKKKTKTNEYDADGVTTARIETRSRRRPVTGRAGMRFEPRRARSVQGGRRHLP